MVVITNKGMWHGGNGKRQITLDLRFNRVGLFVNGEPKYPANAYFDKVFKKKEENLADEVGKVEKEILEGETLVFLGEPGGYVAFGAENLINDQKKSENEDIEERVIEVLVKEGSALSGIEEKRVREVIDVVVDYESRERHNLAILLSKSAFKKEDFIPLLKYILHGVYTSGKEFVSLCGGKTEKENTFYLGKKTPAYRFEVLKEDDCSPKYGFLKYRVKRVEEKEMRFTPGLCLLLSFSNIPPSALRFFPYVLYLSFGAKSGLYPLDNLKELREEIEDKSKNLAKEGEEEMRVAKADRASKGRVAAYYDRSTLEIQLGYLEFESKTDEGEPAWVVSRSVGTSNGQTLVREKELVLLPKEVDAQESLARKLFRKISLLELGEEGEDTSSYYGKEVPKLLWELSNKLKLSWVKVTCVAAPFALEGEDANGYHFYFRERGGHASLSLVTRPGVSFSTALDKNIPLIVVEHEGDFVVGSNHEETVEVISNLYKRARKFLEKMYT
jgi:hypothetical protein